MCGARRYTEFSDRGSVYALISSATPYSLMTVHTWSLEIALALEFIHSKCILHRDLKSANVLLFNAPRGPEDEPRLAEAGAGGAVTHQHVISKICDFGLAAEWVQTNKPGKMVGTFRWMAPEVMRGGQATVFSDVYAYGMLLYELGTREAPFAAIRESPAVVWAVAGEEARPPIPRGFPSMLGGIVRGCWDSEPSQRLTLVDVVDILTPTLHLQHLTDAMVRRRKPSTRMFEGDVSVDDGGGAVVEPLDAPPPLGGAGACPPARAAAPEGSNSGAGAGSDGGRAGRKRALLALGHAGNVGSTGAGSTGAGSTGAGSTGAGADSDATPVHSTDGSADEAHSFHASQKSWTGEIKSRLDEFVKDVSVSVDLSSAEHDAAEVAAVLRFVAADVPAPHPGTSPTDTGPDTDTDTDTGPPHSAPATSAAGADATPSNSTTADGPAEDPGPAPAPVDPSTARPHRGLAAARGKGSPLKHQEAPATAASAVSIDVTEAGPPKAAAVGGVLNRYGVPDDVGDEDMEAELDKLADMGMDPGILEAGAEAGGSVREVRTAAGSAADTAAAEPAPGGPGSTDNTLMDDIDAIMGLR